MDIRENCGDEGRILPKAGNGDEDVKYFRWRDNE
jgi:hypothetical protein